MVSSVLLCCLKSYRKLVNLSTYLNHIDDVLAQSKVAEFKVGIFVQYHILWFEIAKNNSLAVQKGQSVH